ncbi:MAG TPA: YXWGXW repeat-containing protein [Puia sp.]|nr:YXWGXW repeat-containing protein [Puia sp.]
MKSFLVILTTTCLFFLAGCSARVVATRPADVEYARPIAPGADYIWIDGDWIWAGGGYHWHEGHWDKARPGRKWHGGSWESHGSGWRWNKGHWE